MTDTEMDNTRDVRRGTSRFSRSRQIKLSVRPNNTKKLSSGSDGVWDFVTLVKSKKERVRKLSAVGRASSSYEEMGCEVSDREDDFGSQSPPTSVCTSRRFKVPMKFFDDCNGVDHASVPRKLRSAMKKRNRESISPPLPDSKKLNHPNDGVESPQKDDSKKSKLNMKQGGSEWCPRQNASVPITKDEEEVAETLFALAGMFPDKEATAKSELEGESLEAVPSALPDEKRSLTRAFEGSAVSKEEMNSECPSRTADDVKPSIKAEELTKEKVKLNCLNNPSDQGLSQFPDSKLFPLETYSSVPQVKLQTMPFSSKNEPSNDKTLCNSLNFGIASELSLDRGFKQPKEQGISLPERIQELAPGLAASLANQLEQHSIKDGKKNGLALWPGLSSTTSEGAGSQQPILPSSTSKIPAWLNCAPSASSCPLFEASFPNDKVSEHTAHKKSWKPCAAHVYIGRLIQALQKPEKADRPPLQPTHLKPSEGPKKENVVASSFDGVRNGLNGIVSSTRSDNCSPEKSSNELRSVFQTKNLYQDQQHAGNASGPYSSHKQSLDFFSLSSGGGGVDTTNGIQRSHKGSEPISVSQFQIPSLNPLGHHHSQLPLTMSQTGYSSSAYPDRLSSATLQVQLHLPHYLGNPYSSNPHANPTPIPQHHQTLQQSHHYQQQQQQQQFWAAQLAAQYRPTPAATSMSTTLLQNWQNGRQDPPTAIQPAQAGYQTSMPSLDVLGSKYIPISQQQQQQQFMAISSTARIKRQEHHIPSAYEEAGGSLRAGGALPWQLQLLCNERL